MSEAVASKYTWGDPTVRELGSGVAELEFRDSVVRLRDGIVVSYFDKLRSVRLEPSTIEDEWVVLKQDGTATGQRWKGSITYDGNQLLIQQPKNALIRIYRLDASILTQYRRSRVEEVPGWRTIYFADRATIYENVETGNLTLDIENDTFVRGRDGVLLKQHADGTFERIDEQAEREARRTSGIRNEAVEAFRLNLKGWKDLLPLDGNLYLLQSPPGFSAEPGTFFRSPAEGKPDNLREVVTHDFEDGTVLYEYYGRLDGVPYFAHEITTYDGLMLARFIEYDQPRAIDFIDDRNVHQRLQAVLSVEIEFDPDGLLYATVITDKNNDTRTFRCD